jgi:crotonobetainyl-CoA:carnitine CoA-transferase CaiB-like acyl-CoA transferase
LTALIAAYIVASVSSLGRSGLGRSGGNGRAGAVSPLGGLLVVDVTAGIAGQFAGKLLARFGADVILVEPPGGTPTRRLAPLGDQAGEGALSFLFWNLSEGKQSVVADLAAPGDRARFDDLCRSADVILHDRSAALPADLPPSVITCEVSDFPADGPYAAWQGTEMIHQALAGVMFITGRPDREPLYGVGHRAYYAAGVTAWVTTMAALIERQRSGAGQRTRATVFESVAAMAQNQVTQYSYNQTYQRRVPLPGFLALLRCADSWVVLFGLRNWPAICQAFGFPELAADPRFAAQADRRANWAAAIDLLQERAAGLRAADVVEQGQRLKVNIEEVSSLAGLAGSAQWQARGMTVPAAAPDGKPGRALGPVFRILGSEYPEGAPAPALGAADGRVSRRPPTAAPARTVPALAGVAPAGPAGADGPGRGGPGQGGPLAGIRVLDFTTAWAGPMTTRSLAFLGAQVIKIEPPARLDSWRGAVRGGVPERFPDLDPGARPYNRSSLFNTQAHDKLSLALDLTRPGGRDVILGLARGADLVVANFSSGVLDRLGVGYAALSAVNPRVSVIEMPAFGAGGPAAGHVGMGITMEAATGMTGLMGYGDGRPAVTGGTYLDPVGGLHGAAAALVALYQRELTGQGCRIEVAQTEAAAHWIGEFFLEQLRSGSSWVPHGNQVAYAAPHDAYPCAGADEWVAIAVRDDGEWQRLCAVIGRDDLAGSARYAAAAGRHEHQAELRPVISSWTQGRAKAEAAAALQAAGVPAAPVHNGRDIAGDPALRAAGFMVSLEHPEAGRHDYPGLAFRLDRTPGRIRRPAPCFGEHNRFVLSELLGLDDAAIEALYAAGAVADQPRQGSEVS